MAMEDPILFTGKELNFTIPKMTEMASAEQRFRDKITKNEKQQEDWQNKLLEDMDVDMPDFVSKYITTQQGDMSSAFQDKWTKKLKDGGGKLTFDQQVEMKNDKAAMARRQGQWKNSEAAWQRDKAETKAHPGDFDMGKFAADTDTFMSTGEYSPDSLEFSGINMSSFFTNEQFKGSSATTQDVSSNGGFDKFTETKVNCTEAEAKDHVLQTILSDSTGRALKGVIKDFQALPPEARYAFLEGADVDKDKKVSDQELSEFNVEWGNKNILTNPIIQWAKNTYWPSVMKSSSDETNKRRISDGTTKGPTKDVVVTTDAYGKSKKVTTYKGLSPDASVPGDDGVDAVPEVVEETGIGGAAYIPPKSDLGVFSFEMDQEPRQWNIPSGKRGKIDKRDMVFKSINAGTKVVTFKASGKDGGTVKIAFDKLSEEDKNLVSSLKVQGKDGSVITLDEMMRRAAPASDTGVEDFSQYLEKK